MNNFLYKIPLKLLVSAQKGIKPITLHSEPFSKSVPYLDINALEEGIDIQYTYKELCELTNEEEILVVWDGSRSGLAFRGRFGAVGSTLMRLKPFYLLPDYLFYFLKSQFEFINGNTSGSSIPHVDSDLFYNLEIPYTNMEFQKLIINNIEEKYRQNSLLLIKQKEVLNQILSTADVKVFNDDDIEKAIKQFRQAVIERAINGELTKIWRINNKKEAWEQTTLDQVLLEKPKNGYSPKPVNYETQSKVLTLSATTSGNFDEKQFKYFDEKVDVDSDLWLKKGDILVQRGNSMEHVGVSAIYTGNDNEYIYPDLMIRIRPNNKIINEFLLLILSSESSRNFLREKATGSSGSMPKINQKTLLELPVNIPSFQEQQHIIQLTEELLEISNRVVVQYKEAIAHFNQLEKSILNEIFQIKDLQPYTDNHDYKTIEKEIKLQRQNFEKEQSLLKKKRLVYVKKSFLKSSEQEKIKSKIKEIAIEDFSESEYISPEDIKMLSKKINDIIVEFDYDDFWGIFKSLLMTS